MNVFNLRNLIFITPGLIALGMGYSPVVLASQAWTLESSVQRVLEVAPESQAGQQMIGIRKSEQEQAGLWPNPEIEIRADEAIGLDDGSGGYDFTELVVSQPIPLSRLGSQVKQADAMMSATRWQNVQQQLKLEHQTALLFHELQLKTAFYKLSQQRLKLADQFRSPNKSGKQKKNQLVRYLSPLEQKRLEILHENARQEATSAEGELNEIASRFRILLNLDQQSIPAVSDLSLMSQAFDLQQLQHHLVDHPQLQSARHEVEVAKADIELAKTSRYKDPSINLSVERDNFNGQRETYTGVSVSMEIPLWNENAKDVSIARAGMIRAKTDLEMQRREIKSQLQQSYVHYGHLLEQARNYRKKLLEPAEELFQLSLKSFTAGEQNILGLVDGYNTYFDIRSEYMKLLASIGKELASLRLAAGLSVLSNELQGGAS